MKLIGQKVMYDIELKDIIGEGMQAPVYSIQIGDNTYALKISPDRSEMECYKALNNAEYFPEIFDMGKTEDGQYFIIIKYLKGYSLLNQYLHNHKSEKNDIKQRLSVIFEYMKAKRVIHGDLHTENIMIDPITKDIKIIDFGKCVISDIVGDEDKNHLNIYLDQDDDEEVPEWF